jgi:hypothetical protein
MLNSHAMYLSLIISVHCPIPLTTRGYSAGLSFRIGDEPYPLVGVVLEIDICDFCRRRPLGLGILGSLALGVVLQVDVSYLGRRSPLGVVLQVDISYFGWRSSLDVILQVDISYLGRCGPLGVVLQVDVSYLSRRGSLGVVLASTTWFYLILW